VEQDSGAEYSVYAERLYFTLENEEVFRFIVPFTGKTLLVLVSMDEEKNLLKIYPR
jgi:hypothetical protein